jgi:uroporphyrinogen III methyltransferase/synthase
MTEHRPGPERGVVYLVGAGPGDPGLVTKRGLDLIERADVIVHDRLVSPQLLERAPERSELVYAGKDPNSLSTAQDAINELLVARAREGKLVVRLKGGDPFVFGRGGEEAEALAAAGIPFEVVPGVSAAVAVPAYAGIPLTHRALSSSFAVVTGHGAPGADEPDWGRLATAVDTLVVMMGVGALPRIVEALLAHGRMATTPVALIRWGTTVAQATMVGTLADIVERARLAQLAPPVVAVIGDVVALRKRLRWFEEAARSAADVGSAPNVAAHHVADLPR